MRHAATSPDRADGFTLVEALVTTMLIAIAMNIALWSYDTLSQTADAASLMADTNLNLRNALNVMTRDLLSAGRDIPVGGIAIPSGNGAQPIVRPSRAGTNLTFPVGNTTLSAVTPGDGVGPVLGNAPTDMVTVLVADTALALNQWPLTAVAVDGQSVTVDARTPIDGSSNGVTPGDLIMLSSATGNTIQTVTDRVGQMMAFGPNDGFNLNQSGASQGTLVQLQSSPGVYPPMTATRVLMISYYIDVSTPERPLLMRRLNMRADQAIGVAIENFQITYDLVDGALNPVNVPTPVAPNSPNQIRKANVFLAGRSYRNWDRTRAPLRASAGTQVSLRSLSFRDRYQ